MLNFVAAAVPYLLAGIIVYLIFRAVIWLLYYNGEMRVPLWHELGFALLGFWFFALFCSSLSPALGFSLKPSFQGADWIPVKGMIDMVKENGALSLLGAVLKYALPGFLIPFLFRRFQNFGKVILLCGGVSLFTEIFQLFLSGAKTSLNEFLLSLLGTFLGYFLFGLLCMYYPSAERMGTVKRSRRKEVSFAVKRELEFLILVLFVAVMLQGAKVEKSQNALARTARQELARKQQEAEEQAAQEEEARRLAEEEAKKLQVAEQMPDLSLEAGSACLFSLDDNMILYEKNAEEQVIPASTTKLMTALTVLKYCGVDETLTAGEEIRRISAGASTASLKVGTKGSVETFICALLLPSGNDAAYALANYAGHKILGNNEASTDEAVGAFVSAMNELGTELGLENSNFASPDGDGESNYTTARDMIRVARACLENETIMKFAGKRTSRALFETMDVTYKNTNLLLQSDSEYYYEGAIGLKTGSFGDEKCLVGALEVDGRRYVTAVMRDSEEGRWKDTKTLFDHAAGDGGGEE